MYQVTTAPALEPVTLAEAKTQLKVDTSLENALITSLITAAREIVERRTGRALIEQTVTQTDSACYPIRFALNPVISVSSVKIIDTDENETTLSPGDYRINRTRLKNTLEITAAATGVPVNARDVVIIYQAGYGAAASDVPEALKNYILLLVNGLYENRGAVSPVNLVENPLLERMLEPFVIHPGF